MSTRAVHRSVLRTERLVLRPLDAELARALLDPGGGRSPAVAPGFPSTLEQGLLERLADSGDEPVFVIEHAGRVVGTCGPVGAPDPDGDQEIFYTLVPVARGQGLASEAVGALCAVLEPHLAAATNGSGRLLAQVHPDNAPSLRLLHRLGFVETAGAAQGHLLLARAPRRPRIRGRHVC